MCFYDRINELCNIRGIKLTPLVKEIGLSTGVIKNWKSGTIPSGAIIVALAKRLEVTTDVLLTGAPNIADNEKSLLNVFSKLDSMNKARIMERAEMLLEEQERQQADTKNVG